MLCWLSRKGLPLPTAICDNGKQNHGTYKNNIPIISFEEALETYPDLYILISTRNYGDDIEKQVLQKLTKEKVINIAPYFREPSLFAQSSKETQQRIKLYTSSLRGLNNEKFTLAKPCDIPESAKKFVEQYEKYMEAYENGQDMTLPVDDFFVKINNFEDVFFHGNLEEYQNNTKEVRLLEFLNNKKYDDIYKVGPNNEYFVSEYVQLSRNCIDILSAVENVSKFNNYLSDKNIQFLYVQLPSKIPPNYNDLPYGLMNIIDVKASDFVNGLIENHVPALDYRKVMIENNINYWESFYKTDIHWKTSAAFGAVKTILKELEKNMKFEYDKSKVDIKNYERLLYKDVLLGNYGKQVGILYGGLDDFELFLPKYETEYTWTCEEKGFVKHGTMEEALLNPIHSNWDFYNMYMYGIHSLIRRGLCKIKNHKMIQGKKIVCIHDSFAIPMSSFLAPHFSELHFIDIRVPQSKHIKKELFELIDEVKPDMVLMMYSSPEVARRIDVTDVNPYIVSSLL